MGVGVSVGLELGIKKEKIPSRVVVLDLGTEVGVGVGVGVELGWTTV